MRRTTKPADRHHHGDLRRALVDQALAIVEERSVEGLSLRELARRAGVTPAAPYHHFKDKAALLEAVGAEGFRRMAAVMDRETAKAGDVPSDRMSALGRGYVLFAVEHPSHFALMMRRDLLSPEEHPTMEAESEVCFGKLLEVVGEVLGPHATPEKIDRAATTAWSAVHGLAVLWIGGPMGRKMPGRDLEQLIEAVTATLALAMERLAEE